MPDNPQISVQADVITQLMHASRDDWSLAHNTFTQTIGAGDHQQFSYH